ncbi:MAG: hypothetical protein WBC73_15285, partial [Phormidesmis sp.]
RGLLKARQIDNQYPKYWIIWANVDELTRLKALRQRSVADTLHQRWKAHAVSINLEAETVEYP